MKATLTNITITNKGPTGYTVNVTSDTPGGTIYVSARESGPYYRAADFETIKNGTGAFFNKSVDSRNGTVSVAVSGATADVSSYVGVVQETNGLSQSF